MTQKQPQAGEWWQKEDTRVFIIGVKKNGLIVGETECGTLIPFMPIHGWQHLPDCDSWTWRPEVWPQYWTTKYTDSNRDVAFVELKQDGDWIQHYRDGGEYLMTVVPLQKKGRTQLTKEQAEAMLDKPQESPDDWVEITDPEHMPRDGVDYFNGGTNDAWIVHEPRHVRSTLGEYQKSWSIGKFRCRRKDLPVMTQPKCVPVRLVCSTEDIGSVNWRMHDDPGIAGETEIKHDGYKFYVEVQQ